jgi:methionyl-tRNA formyltransferase
MSEQIKVIFFGTPTFAVPSLEKLNADKRINICLVVTQPDSPQGRSKKLVPSEIKQVALKLKLPVINSKINSDFKEEIAKYGPFDLGVVVAYGAILPEWLLRIPAKGVLNIHPSKLPLLRGPSPIQTILLLGQTTTAISYILLDNEMDHGPIVSQIPIPISESDTFTTLSSKLATKSSKEFPNVVCDFIDETLKARVQNHKEATFSKIIKKEDGHISWNTTNAEIMNKVRALNPWPSTFAFWNGKKIKIINTRTHLTNATSNPGLVKIENNSIIVETKNGEIEILNLQLEGKKPLSSRDFLNGYPDIEGSLLS